MTRSGRVAAPRGLYAAATLALLAFAAGAGRADAGPSCPSYANLGAPWLRSAFAARAPERMLRQPVRRRPSGPSQTLLVANTGGMNADEQLTLSSLQGIVNRTQGPTIYVVPGGAHDQWLPYLNVPYQNVPRAWDLIGQFQSLVNGIVVYDPAVKSTIDVATTLAGLQNLLVASPQVASQIEETFPGFQVAYDLRGQFPDDLTAQQWEFSCLWPMTTQDALVELNPSDPGDIREYAVAAQKMVVFLHINVPGEAQLLQQILASMPSYSPFIGWWSTTNPADGEVLGIRFLSGSGGYDVEANWFTNMSVFSQVSAPLETAQPPAPMPQLGNNVYVTMTITDGDNMFYLQHDRPQKWADPARGTVPLNWTINPLIAKYAPTILSFYQTTASPDDYFVTGPSGPGYVYPQMLPSTAYNDWAQQMASYFSQSAITVPFIQNASTTGHGSPLLASSLMQILQNDAAPLGVEAYVSGSRKKFSTVYIDDQTPVAAALPANSVAKAEGYVTSAVSTWKGTSPLFLSLYLYSGTMGPADAAQIASDLAAKGSRYQVVRGDQFFCLMRQANNLSVPGTLCPTGQSGIRYQRQWVRRAGTGLHPR